jgi:hypothetical protein
LLIGGNVSQCRLLLELVNHFCGPSIEFRLIGIFKRVLELVSAGTIVNRQVLHRLHVEMYAVHSVQFGMETGDYRCCVDVTFREWLEIDLDSSTIKSRICPINADEGRQACDRSILQNHLR